MRGYSEVTIDLDRDRFEEYPNGICVHEIELILGDDPEIPYWKALLPSSATIDARRARELAFELLMAAETAEQWEKEETA
jgi:hypothetical protein